jgi:hypothetical protein
MKILLTIFTFSFNYDGTEIHRPSIEIFGYEIKPKSYAYRSRWWPAKHMR